MTANQSTAELRPTQEYDRDVVLSFFQRIDVTSHHTAIIDLDTGALFRGEIDEASKTIVDDLADDTEALPKRYAELQPYDGTGVLQRFVKSNWTDDETLREEAFGHWTRCNGRYAAWKSYAPEAAVNAFDDFQQRELEEHAASELAEHGFRLPD